MRILDGVPGDAAPRALRDFLVLRAVTPLTICILGSSTPAGATATTVANRVVNRFLAMLQSAYPAPAGVTEDTTVGTLDAALATANGVHMRNGAVSGQTSANYADSSIVAKVVAQGPRVIIHWVGSNDYAANVAPATYKANLKTVIDAIDAQLSSPHIHLLIQGHERFDVTNRTYSWAQYARAQDELAASQPGGNVFNIDISGYFYPLGIGPSTQFGTDTLGLMNADKIHMLDAGHALMAEALRAQLGIPATPQAALVGADTTAPSVPGTPTATAGTTSATLSWTSSTDNVGVAAYDVYSSVDNYAQAIASPTTSPATVSGLTAGTAVSFKIAGRDAAGNRSAQSAASNTVTPTASSGADTTAPGATTLTAKPKVASAALSWTAATDDVGVTNYRVFQDGAAITTLGNVLSYTVPSLVNGQRSSFTVAALDAAGNVGPQSAAKLVMPGQIVDNFDRADSSTSLGSTEDGTTWTAPLAHTLSIASGMAKKTYASDASATTGRAYNAFPGTTSTRAFRMAVTLGAAPASATVAAGGPVVRALADGSVFFYLGLRQSTSSFVYALFKVPSVGGSPAGQSANSTVQPQPGDFIELEMTSAAKTTLVVRVNGTQILSTTASFSNPTDATQDNFGLYQAGDSAFEYDSISWTPLA